MRKSNIIKKELEESIEQSKAAGLAADEKEFIAAEVKELEQELEKALEAEKKPAKEPKAPKEKKPVVKKEKMKIVYKGKEVNEDDPEFCSKIVDAWRERKEASKKAEGKRKTKPVIQRVAANIASAVAKGISSIEVEDIKKDPKAAIKQMEELEAAGKDFLAKYKAILGDKITQKEIAEEFSGLDKAIAKISAKYLEKEKMGSGGSIGAYAHNGDLRNDFEKHQSADDVIITTEYDTDVNIDYPYILNINDDSYFYSGMNDRDNDEEIAKKILLKN